MASYLEIDQDAQKMILRAIRVGTDMSQAAAYAGVSYGTLQEWKRSAERELRRRYKLAQEAGLPGVLVLDGDGVPVADAGSAMAVAVRAPEGQELHLSAALVRLAPGLPWFDRLGSRYQKQVEFLCEMQRAEASSAVEALAVIEGEIKNRNWRAAAWKLERRWPELYGRQRTEITGANGGPLENLVIVRVPDNGRGPGGVIDYTGLEAEEDEEDGA